MDYELLYHRMFNVVTDALNALKQQNFGQARDVLVKGQQDCEEQYLEETEEGQP